MKDFVEIFTLENPVFKGFLFYSSLLILKTLAMSMLTARQRFANKAFTSPEDSTFFAKVPKPKVEEKVERVRRAHLNDLENIPLFLLASLGYMMTNPAASLALLLFRIFTIARFLHTFVYAVVVIPQPTRALLWGAGYAITNFMAASTALHFL